MKTALTFLIVTTWFAAKLNAGTLSTVHNFGMPLFNTGTAPEASLIEGPDGTFYGTAANGGTQNYGVVYSFKPGAGSFALKNFANDGDGAYPASELVLSGNTLYGTTTYPGTVFKVNSDGTGFATLYTFTNGLDGSDLQAGLVLSGNVLYGVAGNAPVIYWLDDGQNHTLQTTTHLAAGLWTNAPALNWTNGAYTGLQVADNPAVAAAFFRLVQ
jgi:uncharacterized repeat protein (TIGR03803 family)